MKNILIIIFFMLMISTAQSQTNLQHQIENIISNKQATIGVAMICGKDTIVINGNNHYPMQSVYKFHLALAVLHQVDKGILSLDQKIPLDKNNLYPNTHSPLRDKYPNGNARVALREILEYTVAQSDNNSCDILFGLVGGTSKVNQYMRDIGIAGINIAATEQEMHNSWDAQYTNWSKPLATALLLENFYNKELLSKTTYLFLWNTMAATTTGSGRIRGLLPKDAVVAHKTGSGGMQDNITSACNDAGIVMLPNGKHFTLVVFVMNSKENNDANEKVIAEIAKVIWDYYR